MDVGGCSHICTSCIYIYTHAWMLPSEAAKLPCVRRTRLGREVVPLVCMYITGLEGRGVGGREGAGVGSCVSECVCDVRVCLRCVRCVNT